MLCKDLSLIVNLLVLFKKGLKTHLLLIRCNFIFPYISHVKCLIFITIHIHIYTPASLHPHHTTLVHIGLPTPLQRLEDKYLYVDKTCVQMNKLFTQTHTKCILGCFNLINIFFSFSFRKKFIHLNTYFLSTEALIFQPLTQSHLFRTL